MSTSPVVLDADQLAGMRVLCSFSGPALPAAVATMLSSGRAAGVLLFGSNLPSQAQARALTGAVQTAAAASGRTAVVATDQEGGAIRRVPGPPYSSAAVMGTEPAATIRAQGSATAATLLTWGINVDLAPVADVARPGSFEVASGRSFSSDPATAARAVAAFTGGLQSGGVAATLKHYPGLGAAVGNTDNGPVTVGLSAGTLASVDRVPFAAGIAAGADLVMVSNATYPALAAGPALTAPAIVGGSLRGTLGFAGVVVSDSLDAGAVTAVGSVGQMAVRAAQAGVDLFLGSGAGTCGQVQAALAAAIRSGAISGASALASYQRVAALRGRLRRS